MSTLLTAAVAATLAIVSQDHVSLRASPRDSAPQHAQLTQGDTLEIRGERADYLQVYDHRRERAGFVRATQVRRTALAADEASSMLAVMRFVKDTPGSESLGIAYTAAYLKAAPNNAIDAEPFEILGTLADRLAQRASGASKSQEALVNAQVEAASTYGVRMKSIERDARVRLCYDGEAHRRVLALSKDNAARARAALSLTANDCIDPNILPADRRRLDEWRGEVVETVKSHGLPEYLRNRLELRRASVWSSLAFHRARMCAESAETAEAVKRAVDAFSMVNKTELTDADQATYTEAAIRVSAVRPAIDVVPQLNKQKLAIRTTPGEPGQTCVHVVNPAQPDATLFKQCTYGVVWPRSVNVNAAGTSLALSVQTLDAWRELWVFKRDNDGWHLDVLPPSSATLSPDIGYIDFAGWVPGGAQLLVARESRAEQRYKRSFETLRMDTLTTEKSADHPNSLSTFYRWQDAAWKKNSLALR
ncbi:MAG: hypothetical protein KA260_07555 [Burkholderiales bacterium]|nr:hypothetical protein [Burkholderiales bacterium]